MKDLYRETGTIFRRSLLASPEGESFASRVRAAVADHARQLQGTLARAKREGGRFTHGMAGKKRTTLPGGVIVETWINPFGLAPTLVARALFPGIVGGTTFISFFLETGWLTGQVQYDEFGGVTVTDYRIYCWFELTNFLSSSLWGLGQNLELDEEGYCTERPITSITIKPEFDTNNSYATYVPDRQDFVPGTGFDPNRYSGLARLMMQGKRGAGLNFWYNFESLIGTGFGSNPGNLGVIRSPKGEFWLVHASVSGLIAVKLIIAAEHRCLFYYAGSNAVTGLEQQVFDALTLAYASPELVDGSPNILTLLSSSDMLPAYYNEDGLLMEPLVWGWNWKQQRRGAIDEFVAGAVVVTQVETGRLNNWRVHYAMSTLSFMWDNGIPSCSLSTTAGQFMPPNISRIGTSDAGATCWRYTAPPSPGPAYYADGIVVAWYDKEGQINTLKYNGSLYEEITSGMSWAEFADNAFAMSVCGSGGDSTSATNRSGTVVPVWSVSGITEDTFTLVEENEYSASISLSSGRRSKLSFLANPSQFKGCGNAPIVDGWFWHDGREQPSVGWQDVDGILTYQVRVVTSTPTLRTRHVVLGVTPGVLWWIQSGEKITTTTSKSLGVSNPILIAVGGLCANESGEGSEVDPSIVTYTASMVIRPENVTTTTTTVVVGDNNLSGSVIWDEIAVLSEEDTDIVADAIAYQGIFTPCSSTELFASVSYHGIPLVHGVAIPDGMSTVGTTKRGVFIGGA